MADFLAGPMITGRTLKHLMFKRVTPVNNCRAETETSSSLAYVSYENPKYEQDLAPLVIQVAVISPFFSLPFFSLPFLLHPAILQSSILSSPCHSSPFTQHGLFGRKENFLRLGKQVHKYSITTEVFIGTTAVFLLKYLLA